MNQCRLVMPSHLNSYGVLFGGYMLLWVDEVSWIAASRDYPGCRFVTVGMDRVEFKKSVGAGEVLDFRTKSERVGTTSVTYRVTVMRQSLDSATADEVFDTRVTLVRIDGDGNKTPLPFAEF
jgi:acyl-CoA hydrolase